MRRGSRRLEGVRQLIRVSGRAAEAHGRRRVDAAAAAHRLRRRHGFEYGEMLALGLLDPLAPPEAVTGCVSKHEALEIQRRLNAQDLECLTENKVVFYRHCEALGLRVPALLGVVARGSSGWSRSGRSVTTADDWEALVRDDLPDEFVVKPALGFYGMGVQVLSRRDGGLVAASGRRLAARDVWGQLQRDRRFTLFVVQERLHNGAQLQHLGGGRALQTLRVITFARRSGEVEVLGGLLKLALGDDGIDNFQGGATGNAVIGVDVDSGVLGAVQTARPDGCGLVRSPLNPVSGARIEGQVVPQWDDVRRMVIDASRHFLPVRTIGWDVALTTRGPVIVEANMWWDPFGMGMVGRAAFERMLADVEA